MALTAPQERLIRELLARRVMINASDPLAIVDEVVNFLNKTPQQQLAVLAAFAGARKAERQAELATHDGAGRTAITDEIQFYEDND